MSGIDEMQEKWWRDVYLPTLTPDEREVEIAGRGWLWRYLQPQLLESIQRSEDVSVLGP